MRSGLRDKIVELLQEINPDICINETNHFVDDGLLNSFDIANLVASFEEEYGIDIDGEDILPENFNTIEAMEKLIDKYLH